MRTFYMVDSVTGLVLNQCQANNLSHARAKFEGIHNQRESATQFVTSAADYASEKKLIEEQIKGGAK